MPDVNSLAMYAQHACLYIIKNKYIREEFERKLHDNETLTYFLPLRLITWI